MKSLEIFSFRLNKYDCLYGRLNKSLYGIVQKSYVFYNELRSYMIHNMYIIQCQSDTCLFRYDNNELFIVVYVDDILVVGSEEKLSHPLQY